MDGRNRATGSMSFRVLSASKEADVAAWLQVWQSWPDREVFAHPLYVRLYADKGADARCAVWQRNELTILYPFLLRDLSSEPFAPRHCKAFDITAPYGYGGPFVWGPGDRDAAARDFWPTYREWASENAVAAEFIRFSLFASELLPYPGQTWSPGSHIIRELDGNDSALWMDFDRKVRKNVNKATRAGVRIELDECGARLDDFLGIYAHTMERRQAEQSYRFSRQYFEALRADLQGQFAYFYAFLDQRAVSSELVLISEQAIYSFLGGTIQDAFYARPNDLLKLSIMQWAAERGVRQFVLGGGYHPSDGIHRYKLALAPRGEVPYYLGGQVIQRQLYEALVQGRGKMAIERNEDWTPQPGFFPAYAS
jgi:hypothetical protein